MRVAKSDERVSAAQPETRARGETFYPGPSCGPLAAFPPKERWDDWVELDSRAWPQRVERHYQLIPTTCFNCESACGLKLTVDEYYRFIFTNSVPGLPAHAAAAGHTPIEYMRRRSAYEVQKRIGPVHLQEVPAEELGDLHIDAVGRVFTRTPKPPTPNLIPLPTPDGDAEGRRLVGVQVQGKILRGFPTPSGRLEFYSKTLKDWGWPECALPTYLRSHIYPDRLEDGQLVLIPTFRLPVHIHTRSANAKWLDEIAHTNPLWLHTRDAARIGVRTGDLVRVETEIGPFVVKAWVTEGIRPGVVGCSHHMGRWKLTTDGQRQLMATVGLERRGTQWVMSRKSRVAAHDSADADSHRIWWTDAGVHQNLTFPVHPDPLSGMHCWHQAVRVTRAAAGDRYGDVVVDTDKAHAVSKQWLTTTRPADRCSPDGTCRPYWLLRPLKPARAVYQLPAADPQAP